MNDERIESIVRNRGARIRPNHNGFPERGYRILALDTETVNGWPYTLQLCDGERTTLDYLEPRQFIWAFLRWLHPHVARQSHSAVIVWGHVLKYDLAVLFYPYFKRLAEGHFEMDFRDVHAEVFYGTNPFATFTFPHGRKVYLVDTFAFVRTSLRKAADLFKLPYTKLPRPRGLGRVALRGREFEDYARRDADVTWHLGSHLLRYQERFDVSVCVSVAHLAARIFAHNYVHEPLAVVPRDVETAALFSYHGGKGAYYRDAPQWIRCTEYDISSAYPWAMTKIDSMTAGRWEHVRSFNPKGAGFYRIAGQIRESERFPILYSHEFVPLRGEIDGAWVTSYELAEALARREFALRRCEGYVWVPRPPFRFPLREFARDFYRLKETAQAGPERMMFKTILNSLYGKFIQLTEQSDGTLKPGGFFHPVLASWITAQVRVRLHRLEHQTNAIHSATDAIHTTQKMTTGRGLGCLEKEISGPCLFVRHKVYFHFSGDGERLKYALHGIRAPLRYAWNVLSSARGTPTKDGSAMMYRYRIGHILQPRESARLGTRPLQQVNRWYMIRSKPVPMMRIPQAARDYWRNQRGSRVHRRPAETKTPTR